MNVVKALVASLAILVPITSFASELGVYNAPGSLGVEKLATFDSWLGNNAQVASDGFSYSSWTDMVADAKWAVGAWAKNPQPVQMQYALPLTVIGTSLIQVANGIGDIYFTQIAQILVANNQGNAIIRLGWEFNGNWYPWTAQNNLMPYMAAFRHVATLLKNYPNAHFTIVWNPTIGNAAIADPRTAYPGNAYVDAIGLDIYDQSWPSTTNPTQRWNTIKTESDGLNFWAAFAANEKKPLMINEWGVVTRSDGHGGGDDPLFIDNMYSWFIQNNVILQVYFNAGANSNFDATLADHPLSAAEYKKLF